jgi:adenylosuccinate synthase
MRIGLRCGDMADWDLFTEKYNKFIDRFQYQFHVTDFDRAAELDELKMFHEKMMADNMLVDSLDYVHDYLRNGKRIIAEGANATMLDMDQGTYPYVTSSSTTVGGVCTGLGVPPQKIETSIGIVKAYTTRVGAGPFPTWLQDDIGERLQTVGNEFGATTGRKRKCGWLDLNVVKYSHKINGFASMNITKLDVMTGIPTIKVATHYELDGKKLEGSMPACIEDLGRCETKYVELPGWEEDISTCTSFD